MPQSYASVPTGDIVVVRDRFRPVNEKRIGEIITSIKTFGQLVPLIVESNGDGKYALVDGLHRLTAVKALELPTVDIAIQGEMNELLARELELETNIQRVDMTWLERAKAIAELDRLKKQGDPNWSSAMTGAIAGVDKADVSRASTIVKMVELFPEIAGAKSLLQAQNWAKAKATNVLRVEEVKNNNETYAAVDTHIWLGDSVELIKQVPDNSFRLILTDPPFGINYDDRVSNTVGAVSDYQDDTASYERLLSMAPDLYRVLQSDGFLIWFLGISWYERAKQVFRAAGFVVDECPIIWDRSGGRTFTTRPDRWFTRGYDIALHCVKGEPRLVQQGKSNVISIPPVGQSERELLVERPVDLYEELIRRCTIPGERVADFFVGSGSCPAAAARLGRKYFGCELNPERRAAAIKKITAYTPDQ